MNRTPEGQPSMDVVRRIFFENFTQKACALALAVVLFVLVREDQTAVITRSVKVRVSHPEAVMLKIPPVEAVTLTVEGKFSRLRELDRELPETLDLRLSGAENEPQVFVPEMFKLPPGLVIRSIQPPSMMVQFEPRTVRRRPVVAKVEGEPAEGFRVVQISVQPSEVTVQGPASVVNALKEVETQPIRLEGRDRSTTLRVGLTSPSPTVVFQGPQGYTVTLEIEEKQGTLVVSQRPVKMVGLPLEAGVFEVSPDSVDITLHGPVRLLDALDVSTLFAYVDASDVDPGRRGLQERPLKFDPPEGLRVGALSPSKAALARKDEPVPPIPDAGVNDAGVIDAGAGTPAPDPP